MRFSLPLVVIIALVFLAVAGTTFAQSQNITESEYWAGIRTGYASARKSFPRRETEKYEGFTDGTLTLTRIKNSEYQAADKYHIVIETLRDGRITISEKIQIEALRYCKESPGEWKTSGCYDSPPPPLEDAKETSYVLQKIKNSTAYIRTASFSLKVSGQTEPTKFLTEDTLILNADLSVRERTIVKSIQATKKIASRESQKFEYGLNFKLIKAPIK